MTAQTDYLIRHRSTPFGDVFGELLIDGELVLSHTSSSTTWLRADLLSIARSRGFTVPNTDSEVKLEGRTPAPERSWAVVGVVGHGIPLYGCTDCGAVVYDQPTHAEQCP